MGLTIHYSGKIKPARIDECLNALESIAKKNHWQYERHDDKPATKYERQGKTGQFIPVEHLCKTISLILDPGCEWLTFDFDKKTGKLQNFCKTQYSENFIATHHLVCKILEMVRDKFVPNLDVSDEGDYFGIWDREKLGATIEEWDKMVMGISRALQESWGDDNVIGAGPDMIRNREV